jgi:hypothetical protein
MTECSCDCDPSIYPHLPNLHEPVCMIVMICNDSVGREILRVHSGSSCHRWAGYESAIGSVPFKHLVSTDNNLNHSSISKMLTRLLSFFITWQHRKRIQQNVIILKFALLRPQCRYRLTVMLEPNWHLAWERKKVNMSRSSTCPPCIHIEFTYKAVERARFVQNEDAGGTHCLHRNLKPWHDSCMIQKVYQPHISADAAPYIITDNMYSTHRNYHTLDSIIGI